MKAYNWDLIERLLHEVQNGEGSFAPRKYAEQEAADKATAGEFTGDLDALKKTAADYGVDVTPRLTVVKTTEPEGRKAGIIASQKPPMVAARKGYFFAAIFNGAVAENCEGTRKMGIDANKSAKGIERAGSSSSTVFGRAPPAWIQQRSGRFPLLVCALR